MAEHYKSGGIFIAFMSDRHPHVLTTERCNLTRMISAAAPTAASMSMVGTLNGKLLGFATASSAAAREGVTRDVATAVTDTSAAAS